MDEPSAKPVPKTKARALELDVFGNILDDTHAPPDAVLPDELIAFPAPKATPRLHKPSHGSAPPFFQRSLDMAASPNQLTPVLEAKLKNVSEAIVNKPPLCSGTWAVPTESFQLSFSNGDDSAG